MQRIIFGLIAIVIASGTACVTHRTQGGAVQPIVAEAVRARPTSSATHGAKVAIATQGIASTEAAQKILRTGGNIIDAAVATSFVISVERPQSTGLGGGGFMLYREAKTGRIYAIDFRERAPMAVRESMYDDTKGNFDHRRSQNGTLAVGVPGLVAGLYEIHKRFGSLPFKDVVQPAIDLAEKGFPVYAELALALKVRAEAMRKDPGARAIFLDAQGEPWKEGHTLIQKDLAQTLRLIAKRGSDGFYRGPVAEKILSFMKKNHGLIRAQDLRSYTVKWREPVTAKYKGYDVYSMPPPSSGGVHVIQFLGFLEKDELYKKGFLSAPSIHLAAAALQSAFADRAVYLGDPDFVSVPTETLVSADYISKRRRTVSLDKARSMSEVGPGDLNLSESEDTTHFSMMDAEGNAVSSTQTINGWMGAAIVAPGTGVVLNNEMDDFAAHDGSANLFGAVGGRANAIEPGKTPLSSMSPTILIRDGEVQMVVGAPGGTRIISCVAQTILNWTEFQMPLADAISTIRYHHQWKPDELSIEAPGPGEAVIKRLEKMGYQVKIKPIGCKVMAVARENGLLSAVSDPRDIGTSWVE